MDGDPTEEQKLAALAELESLRTELLTGQRTEVILEHGNAEGLQRPWFAVRLRPPGADVADSGIIHLSWMNP